MLFELHLSIAGFVLELLNAALLLLEDLSLHLDLLSQKNGVLIELGLITLLVDLVLLCLFDLSPQLFNSLDVANDLLLAGLSSL